MKKWMPPSNAMDCLIIAAGKGTRIQSISQSKPLIRLGQSCLIDHVILRAREGGATRFFVVTGYRGDELRHHLERLADAQDIAITCLENSQFEEPNGYSVLAAKDCLTGPFILTMCDHIVDPDIIRDLADQPLGQDEIILAVDHRLDNPAVDLEDVTRVFAEDGFIREIGKGIENYNAFDTGVFLASPAIFGAIEHSIEFDGDGSLSGGVRRLLKQGRARICDIGDRTWIDVDDEVAFDKARHHLRANS